LQAERRSPGDEQGAYGAQSGYGEEGRYAREESRSTPGPSFENRGGQSLGQRSLGPSESYGLAGVPSDRPMGSDRGFVGDQGRDDRNGDDWSRSDPYRDRWAAERSRQSGATGMSTAYPSRRGSTGFGSDEERMADWGETDRDRDQGQGRRFWQREPLAAR